MSHLTLQVLKLLPTIPLDISFHTTFPMMLEYGLESYSLLTWLENEEETFSLGEGANASHILGKKLEQMADRRRKEAEAPSGCLPRMHSCIAPHHIHHLALHPT